MSEVFAGFHADDLAFPRQSARTQSLTLGIARNLTLSPDGARLVFLRSKAGADPTTCLWVLDVATGQERCVFDPREHLVDTEEPGLTDAERARRERVRERASGVVAYAHDRDVSRAVFVEGGRLLLADLNGGDVQELPAPGVPDDPRLSPDGMKLAYVVGGVLHVQDIGGEARVLASDPDPDVFWGLADFAAAEEMRRFRGFWWSPDGSRIAACRVDERPVHVWWLSDPTDPSKVPHPMRYPQAGTPNAIVTLHVFDVASGAGTEIVWDREGFEYLAGVVWAERTPLTLSVQSRDQRTTQVLEADLVTGQTRVVREDTDPTWVELIAGSPTRMADGSLVTTVDDEDTRRLVIGLTFATPPGLQVHSVIDADEAAWFQANDTEDPTELHVWRVAPDTEPERVSREPGVHAGVVGGGAVALKSYGAEEQHPRVVVRRPDGSEVELASTAEEPVVDPRPVYASLGERELRAALLLPGGHEPARPLPVLMSPYGGPHDLEVIRWRGSFRSHQYFADRLGVAVLCIDGRGTPGRGTAWERAIDRDFSITLDDQVDGLHAAAERWPFLDLSRVAIRGWSFGGMLAALAVCTRPDVFHAAVAGAPVTDQRLYDTHYTERYLGDPNIEPEAYRVSSPLSFVQDLRRPLLLIHGLNDDNVVAAHTLQMSAALFAAGIHHELVMLPNASHMGGSAELVVGRYLAELDFLRRSLGLPPGEV